MNSYFYLPLMLFGIVVLFMGFAMTISSKLFESGIEVTNYLSTGFILIGVTCALIGTIKMTDWSKSEPEAKI